MAKIELHALTPSRWKDLEALFGARGACGGCWCMWWRLKRSEFEKRKGAANKRALRRLVMGGPPPGILAYVDGAPAGWIAVGPRESYPALARSRRLAPLDEKPAWAATCFFIARPYRGLGLTVTLLREAKTFARARGGRLLEGFPVAPKKGRMPDAFAWTGLVSAFEKAGFKLAARRGARAIMRSAV